MPKKAAWTIMVYLAGDNNLTTECLFALTEMKKAAPGHRINVIAQFDPRDDFLPTHRYEINKQGEKGALFDDIIDEASYDPDTGEVRFKRESKNADALAAYRHIAKSFLPTPLDQANLVDSQVSDEVITNDTDTGSPVTLYNFISFCIEAYPADHYMVVLSGHAGGTQRDYLMKDESSSGSLTFNELKNVFTQLKADLPGETIDILGMDNCLMSMAEICYELRGLVKIAVGCESYSPASGWPYKPILERLKRDLALSKHKQGKAVGIAVAKAIVEEYVNYYSSYWMAGLSVSQSALDVTRVEKLKKVIDNLAHILEMELLREQKKSEHRKSGRKPFAFKDALLLAHWESQSFNGELFVDLYDFCNCLASRLPVTEVAKACRQVMRFIKTEFVLKSCYSGARYQYSQGVSLYFPWSQVANTYDNLDFIRESPRSGWSSFLRTYTLLTRRIPRGINEKSKLSEASMAMLGDVRMTADRMTADRMTADRMTADRMTADRMTADRMTADRVSGNPVHSMRNPPVVFFPTECIREQRRVVTSQERLMSPRKGR